MSTGFQQLQTKHNYMVIGRTVVELGRLVSWAKFPQHRLFQGDAAYI